MTTLYHGGRLVPEHIGTVGLWATDDPAAARLYAEEAARGAPDYTAVVYAIQVPAGADVVGLRDAVPPDMATDAEADPAVLAYEVELAVELAENDVWAVMVPTGDAHHATGVPHRSWWILGQFEAVPWETVAV